MSGIENRLIEAATTEGQPFVVDVNSIKNVVVFCEDNLIELQLHSGRSLWAAKTPQLVDALFARPVTLTQAQEILASRSKN